MIPDTRWQRVAYWAGMAVLALLIVGSLLGHGPAVYVWLVIAAAINLGRAMGAAQGVGPRRPEPAREPPRQPGAPGTPSPRSTPPEAWTG